MRKLLLSTSVIALALGMGVASASAEFGKPPVYTPPDKDSVVTTVKETHNFSNTVDNDWSWTKTVNEYVHIDTDIDFYIPNLGELTQIANVQKLFGSVEATTNIYANIAPGGGTTTTTTGGTFTIPEGTYAEVGQLKPEKPKPGETQTFEQEADKLANLGGVTVKVPTTTTTTTSATLPIVLGSATAIGNMFSLASSEPTLLLNSDQIHMPSDSYGNVGVTANLTSNVTGAAVKLDSTAISNMLSIDMSAPSVVVGSIMQTSYADVSATANSTQTIGAGYDYASFTGLNPVNTEGGLQVNPPTMKGVVASVNATAIGNMASINLGTYASIPQGAGTNLGK
jgi:hypothetical protein